MVARREKAPLGPLEIAGPQQRHATVCLPLQGDPRLIETEPIEFVEQAYRAVSHFLRYQGIAMRRWEAHDLYFQVMKQQFAATQETFPEFDVVAVWREVLQQKATATTRALRAVPPPREARDHCDPRRTGKRDPQ